MQSPEYLFVYSLADVAGSLMARVLKEYVSFSRINENYWLTDDGKLGLLAVNREIIYTDGLEKEHGLKPRTIIFISRHSSTKKIKTLSVHVSGNPTSTADLGGLPRRLAPSHPLLMKSILSNLYTLAQRRGLEKEYQVTLEVTHHGPSEIACPSCFVEIGSTIDEWRDKRAANAVIEAVLDAISHPLQGYPAIGIGGPHYAPTFTRKVLESEYAIGHIFSKYVLHEVDKDLICDALSKTMNAKVVLLDWKGMKGHDRQRIKAYVEEVGDVEVIKV